MVMTFSTRPFVQCQLHAVGDDARHVHRKHQLLRHEIFDGFDAGAAVHLFAADGDEIDDDVEAAESLRRGLGKADRRFCIAAGVGEQLHLAGGLGKHGGDGVEFGRGGSRMYDETAAMVGEFAGHVDAAARRQPRDKHANTGKLTVV